MKKLLLPIFLLININLHAQDKIDLNHFKGKWYVHSAISKNTQKCVGLISEYWFINPEKIGLTSSCIKSEKKIKDYDGTGIILNEKNSKFEIKYHNFFLKVLGFFGFKFYFEILSVDQDYKHLLTGTQDQEELFIMSRTKEVPNNVLKKYHLKAKALGYDPNKFIKSEFFSFE